MTTKEHFVPRSLFDKMPQQAWTIRACGECNEEKSKNDDYLRDMLVADDSCQWHPVAKALMPNVLRSAARGSSLVAKAARNGRQAPVYSSGSVYMGDLFAVPLEDARLQKVFTWLTRGAGFYFRGARIPDDYTFNFARVDRAHASELWAAYTEQLHPFVQGPGVFGCTFLTLDSDPFTSMWLFGFYQWLEVANLAIPPSSREYMPRYDLGITVYVEVFLPGSPLDMGVE